MKWISAISSWLKALPVPFRATGGQSRSGSDWWSSSLPSSGVNWKRQAGDLWKNSIVSILINWIADSVNEAPFTIKTVNREGEAEYDSEHPLAQLMRRPNPFYSGRRLLHATVLSLAVDGNSYWLKVPDRTGRGVSESWWLPHWMVEPRWESGYRFIDYYEYQVEGRVFRIQPENIVHIPVGMDPENERKGLGWFKALLREIATDNEYLTYTASIARNLGVPGIILGPADPASSPTQEQTDYTRRVLDARTTGDERGKSIFTPFPFKIEKLTFTPEELALDKCWQYIESRACAAAQIPAMVVGLQVGHEQKTFANYSEARRAAWQDKLVPLLVQIADCLDMHLLPHFRPTSGQMCCFDLRDVEALQEDEDKRHQRARENFKAGIWTRGEARIATGRDETPADKVYITDLQAAQLAASVGRTASESSGTKLLRAASWHDRVTAEIEAMHGEWR